MKGRAGDHWLPAFENEKELSYCLVGFISKGFGEVVSLSMVL